MRAKFNLLESNTRLLKTPCLESPAQISFDKQTTVETIQVMKIGDTVTLTLTLKVNDIERADRSVGIINGFVSLNDPQAGDKGVNVLLFDNGSVEVATEDDQSFPLAASVQLERHSPSDPPANNHRVLLCCDQSIGYKMEIGYFDTEKSDYFVEGAKSNVEIGWWMELPKP
jgi:hypothetical protein